MKEFKLVTAEGKTSATYESKQVAERAWSDLNGIWEDENEVEHYIYIEE